MQTIVLEVSPSILSTWRELPHCVRWHIGAFPLAATEGETADVNARLATAFPRMVRRVMAVEVNGLITVRLACEGLHEGMWGDIICPTGRRITFEEQHEIVAVGGRVVTDRIALDVPAIVLQLCADRPVDPDETSRMGKAYRELRERARTTARGDN
jgi:hypothetical protein